MNNLVCPQCHQQLDNNRNHPQTGRSCPVVMQNYFTSLSQTEKDRINRLDNQICQLCNVKRKEHGGSFVHSFTS